MSDAGATTKSTVTVDEITVTKSYETDEFPVPAVAFRLESDRDDEAMVRLTDTVPDDVSPEDLGFHPDYGSDHWSVEDGNAVFERRLDPGEEYQTVYGIRDTDHDPAEFITDPTIDVEGLGGDTEPEETDETESTDESEATDEINDADETGDAASSGRDSSQIARDIISGEDDGSGFDEDEDVEELDISGETTETEETDETTEATEAIEPVEESDEPESYESESEGQTTDREAGTLPEGGVGAALATELREGNLSETDRELLTAELTEENTGKEVRLTHLQSRISDLEAYTDALEEFIDEHGPARRLIEDMTDQLETIEAELDDVDDRTTANEDDIERLDGRTEKNEDDIDALDKGIADVESEVGETQESIEDLREDIEEINGWRTRLSTVLGGTTEQTEDQG